MQYVICSNVVQEEKVKDFLEKITWKTLIGGLFVVRVGSSSGAGGRDKGRLEGWGVGADKAGGVVASSTCTVFVMGCAAGPGLPILLTNSLGRRFDDRYIDRSMCLLKGPLSYLTLNISTHLNKYNPENKYNKHT